MVGSIVYCDVDGNTDPVKELAAVKLSLTTAVDSVKMARVKTSTRPKTAYGNVSGTSILQSIEDMKIEMRQANKKTEDKIAKLEIDAETHNRECRAKTRTLEEQIEVLTQEANVLRPLRNIAVDIRKRFFATSRRGVEEERNPMDDITIDAGNRRAHEGDVITDVALFHNRLMTSFATFTRLYGLPWKDAEKLLGILINSS